MKLLADKYYTIIIEHSPVELWMKNQTFNINSNTEKSICQLFENDYFGFNFFCFLDDGTC